jgi:DNA-binding response OmpR family regulator
MPAHLLLVAHPPELALLKAALQEKGYSVNVAETPQQASDAVSSAQYELFVIDEALESTGDGWTLARRIMDSEYGRGKGIIILTRSPSTVYSQEDIFTSTFIDTVSYPLSVTELSSHIELLLDRIHRQAGG